MRETSDTCSDLPLQEGGQCAPLEVSCNEGLSMLAHRARNFVAAIMDAHAAHDMPVQRSWTPEVIEAMAPYRACERAVGENAAQEAA